MKGYQKKFRIGELELSSNVFCSPLAGCSDLPFRRLCQEFGAGLVFTEMVKMDALVRHDAGSYRLLDYEKGMHPIGAQLVGSKVELAAQSAKLIEDLGFDLIDLNCGCPVDKVTKDGSGSGLLKEPEQIDKILREMIGAVSVPVTLKIRAGWDDDRIYAKEITQMAEEAGAKAIFVHGRTRVQAYRGPSDWKHINACVDVAKKIKVFGNGDAFTAEAVKEMFEETGCDGVLVSRGSFGQPWIFEDVARIAEGLPRLKRDGLYIKRVLMKHMNMVTAYRNEKRSILDMRRVGCWYLKLAHGAKQLRETINRCKDLDLMRRLIDEYPWEEISYQEN